MQKISFEVTMTFDEEFEVCGYKCKSYGIRFDSEYELGKFLKGEVAYDWIDDSYRKDEEQWGHKAHVTSIETKVDEVPDLVELDWNKLSPNEFKDWIADNELEGYDEDDLLDMFADEE